MAVPPNTYPYGYTKDGNGVAGMGTMLTIEQLETKKTVYKLNPEFWRRFKALIQFALTQGVYLGVGTGWRIQPNPPPPGFAAPGNSNHEGFPADGVTGGAVAIDTVPQASWTWMEQQPEGVRAALVPRSLDHRIQGFQRAVAHPALEIPASRNAAHGAVEACRRSLFLQAARHRLLPQPTPPPTTATGR